MIDDELADVRAQVRDDELFSPAVTEQLDAFRASVQQQLRERGIDQSSPECERTMVVAGGIVGQLCVECRHLPARQRPH